jgi:ribose transport system ATP-binding protein
MSAVTLEEDDLLRTDGLSKRFGSIRALHDVNFVVRKGEVMGLVGENGAGKSTLVKILSGIYRPDTGRIVIENKVVDLGSPSRAERAGIAVVQQERSLVGCMSVAENIFLGDHDSGSVWWPRALTARSSPYLELVGLDDIDPRAPVERLSAAERQLVELARMIARNARLFILDEPTAALADAEILQVTEAVRRLSDSGRSVIYVTHRLGEIFELCRSVTVFRDGECLPAVATSTLNTDTLIERMLGRPLDEMYPPRSDAFGEPVVEVENLSTSGLRSPLSFSVRAGEVLALAGQVGSGATAVVRALAGEGMDVSGQIRLVGKRIAIPDTPRAATSLGFAYCSSERKRDGLFAVRSIRENISAPALRSVSPAGLMSRSRELALGNRVAKAFTIDARRLRHRVSNLSGGNQQKVALGKWLSIDPKVLLVEEPTVGVDVGARAEIYRNLRALTQRGLAIIFASSDIQEAIGLSDTITTFHKGRVVRSLPSTDASAFGILRDVTEPGKELSDHHLPMDMAYHTHPN